MGNGGHEKMEQMEIIVLVSFLRTISRIAMTKKTK